MICLVRVIGNTVFSVGKIQIVNYQEQLHLPWRRFLPLIKGSDASLQVVVSFCLESCDWLYSAGTTSVFLNPLPVTVCPLELRTSYFMS